VRFATNLPLSYPFHSSPLVLLAEALKETVWFFHPGFRRRTCASALAILGSGSSYFLGESVYRNYEIRRRLSRASISKSFTVNIIICILGALFMLAAGIRT